MKKEKTMWFYAFILFHSDGYIIWTLMLQSVVLPKNKRMTLKRFLVIFKISVSFAAL